MEFVIKNEVEIYSGKTENGQEYWMFFLYKKDTSGNTAFREFYFDKNDFSFLENIKEYDNETAKKDDFELLLKCKKGPIILDQMKSLVCETEKLKKEENFHFTILFERQWNAHSFVMELSVKDLPLNLHCYYRTDSGELSISLYLKGAIPKCYLIFMDKNKKNYETAALDFIKKNSKQRLRLLTKNVNFN